MDDITRGVSGAALSWSLNSGTNLKRIFLDFYDLYFDGDAALKDGWECCEGDHERGSQFRVGSNLTDTAMVIISCGLLHLQELLRG